MSWSLGYMLLALIAYLIRSWQWLVLAVTCPCLLSIAVWWWLPESARWLLTKKEVETAHGYLSKCAKVNGKEDFPSKITPEVSTVSSIKFGVSFTYYGISLNIGGFSLDPYLTQLTFGAIEIPAKLGVYFVLDHIGRRHCQGWSLIVTGSLIALNTIIPAEHGHVRSAVAILGKGFSEAAFTTVFLYTAELYPTVLRQSGVGCCSFVARLASSIAPLVMLLDDTWKYLPPMIFSVVAGLAGSVAFLLSETTNIQLPETIQDVEGDRNKTPLGDQAHEQSIVADSGGIALGLLNQMNVDALLPEPQEANKDCDKEAISS
nr:solute carrier family 22 member 7-like [Anolis sagrei ordinatus]